MEKISKDAYSKASRTVILWKKFKFNVLPDIEIYFFYYSSSMKEYEKYQIANIHVQETIKLYPFCWMWVVFLNVFLNLKSDTFVQTLVNISSSNKLLVCLINCLISVFLGTNLDHRRWPSVCHRMFSLKVLFRRKYIWNEIAKKEKWTSARYKD